MLYHRATSHSRESGGGGRVREKNARQKDEKECMGKIDGREKRGIGNI